MIEAINRICEQAGELARAKIIIDNKDRQIAEMEKHISKQGEEVRLLNSEVGGLRRAASASANRPDLAPPGGPPIDRQA